MGADGDLSSKRPPPAWACVLAGVSVAVVLVVGVGPSGLLLPRVTTCELGTPLGTYTVWTLSMPLNKPPGVNVSATAESGAWNFTFTSGSLTVGALRPGNGAGGWGDDGPLAGISAQALEMNWSVFGVENTTTIGGPSGACTQPYVAEEYGVPVVGCGGFVTLPLANNSSDDVEPHVWNGTGSGWERTGCLPATSGAYIRFDTAFHTNGSGASAPVRWNLCDRRGDFPLVVSPQAEIPVVVNVPFGGREVTANGFESWQGGEYSSTGPIGGTTANYTVPGGWVWMITPVGPVSAPLDPGTGSLPALVAFERLAC